MPNDEDLLPIETEPDERLPLLDEFRHAPRGDQPERFDRLAERLRGPGADLVPGLPDEMKRLGGVDFGPGNAIEDRLDDTTPIEFRPNPIPGGGDGGFGPTGRRVVVGPCGEVIALRTSVMARNFYEDVRGLGGEPWLEPAWGGPSPAGFMNTIGRLDQELPLDDEIACIDLGALCDDLVKAHLLSMWVDPWRLAIREVDQQCISVEESRTRRFTALGSFGLTQPPDVALFFRGVETEVLSWTSTEITFELPDQKFANHRKPGILELRSSNLNGRPAPIEVDADTITKTCGVSVPDLHPNVDLGTGPWIWILGEPEIRAVWVDSRPRVPQLTPESGDPLLVNVPGCATERLYWFISYDNIDGNLVPHCPAETVVTKDGGRPIVVDGDNPNALESHYGDIVIDSCDEIITLTARTSVGDSLPLQVEITRKQSARVEIADPTVPAGRVQRTRQATLVLGCPAPPGGLEVAIEVVGDDNGIVTIRPETGGDAGDPPTVVVPHRETDASFEIVVGPAPDTFDGDSVEIAPVLDDGIVTSEMLELIPARPGLALGGGGAKGSFQVGALKYMSDNDQGLLNDIDIISGTSVGAINALGMIDSRNTAALERMARVWLQLEKPIVETIADFGTTMIRRRPWLTGLSTLR